MPLYKLSLREIEARPIRTILTLLSIVIGAGAIVATSLASTSARLAQIAMVEAVTGKTTLEIQAVGGASFDDKIVDEIRQVPGVVVASPIIRRYSMMTVASNEDASNTESSDNDSIEKPEPVSSTKKKKFRVQLLGIEPALDRNVRNYSLLQGSDLDSSNDSSKSIWIDAGFAESARVKIGSELQLLTKSKIQTAKIVGLIKGNDASSALRSAIIVAPLRVIQRWTRSQGKIDVVQIVTSKDMKLDELQAKIQALLPEGVIVRPPSLRSQVAGESTVSIQQGLYLATLFALIMATFIIFNTFQMNVGERRRQLGILRALGTTRRQVLWMILREGLWMGSVGSLLGCFAGFFGESVLNRSTSMLLQIDIPGSPWSVWPYLTAFASGMSVSMIGAFVPAFIAAWLSPAEAMRVIATERAQYSKWIWLFVAAFFVFAGMSVQYLAMKEIISIQHAMLGTLSMMLGIMFLISVTLGRLTRWIGNLIGLVFHAEAKLARRQVMKHQGRSTLLIGIMLFAMSFGFGMASTILDNIRNVQGWYQRAIVGDFFLRAAMPDMNSGQAADMPDGLADEIRKIPDVDLVDTLRFVSARSNETSVVVVVREFNAQSQDFFDLVEGDGRTVRDALFQGQVVVGSVLAERNHIHLGDQLPLETNEGKSILTVAAITNEYLAGGLTLYMEAKQAKKLLNVDGTDAIVVRATPEARSRVEKEIRAIGDREGLMFQSYMDLVSLIESTLSGLVGGLWAVLALGSLIAAFGLINTLAMNILEQTREIGMLRVVAMTRWQVRRTILAQALMMSLIGIVPGAFLGIWIAWVINQNTMMVTGHDIKFQFYPWLMATAFGFELSVVVIAAMFPAERAARINLLRALQYE